MPVDPIEERGRGSGYPGYQPGYPIQVFASTHGRGPRQSGQTNPAPIRYALPLPESVDSLPRHPPPEGVTATITTWEYGTVAEILHIGPYDAELPTTARSMAFVEAEGYEAAGGHEEEYVLGPTMAGRGDPHEYRTILRYRVRPASPAPRIG